MNTTSPGHQLVVALSNKTITIRVTADPQELLPHHADSSVVVGITDLGKSYVNGFMTCLQFLKPSAGGWESIESYAVCATGLMDELRDQLSTLGYDVGPVTPQDEDGEFKLMAVGRRPIVS